MLLLQQPAWGNNAFFKNRGGKTQYITAATAAVHPHQLPNPTP
jgi:hypothetical protein